MKHFHTYSDRRSWRMWFKDVSLVEVSWSWGLALNLCKFSDDSDKGYWSLNIHLGWPDLFINLPLPVYKPPVESMLDKWGFTIFDQALHLSWGHHTKVVWLPWSWDCVGHDIRCSDETWVPYIGSWEDKPSDNREEQQLPYRYILKSGDVQLRTATVSVQRWIRRRRWLKWTSVFQWVDQCISVEFDDEVGERSGSWKGGCVGCGYTMKPGETAEQTLRRMEHERKFR